MANNLVMLRLGARGWRMYEVKTHADADRLRGDSPDQIVVLYDAADLGLWGYLMDDVLRPMLHGCTSKLEIYPRRSDVVG